MKWHDIKKNNLKKEMGYVILMAIVILIGVVDEIIIHVWFPRLFVLEYDSVSLVVIQIQATVQTLSIALLALASGKLNESYMGVDYNDFYFNIRPDIFTQKRIIIGSIFLLIINLFLHMAGLYNAVVSVFVVVCLLIVISVKEIYAVFTNQNQTDEEIEAYLLSFADEKSASKKTTDMFKKLCRGWRRISEHQSAVEYDKYLSVYRSLFDVLIFDNDPNSTMVIEKESSELIKNFSKSINQAVQVRSLEFLDEYYEYLLGAIYKNQENVQSLDNGTHILHETYFELCHVISSCSVSSIESVFSLTDFIENCVLCNYWFGYKDGQCYELRDVEELVLNLSYQLGQDGNQDYNDRFWGKLLSNIDTRLARWPENVADKPDVAICNIKFIYAQMLIRSGQFRLVKDYFCEEAVKHIRLCNTKHQIKLFLKVYCYLFYLAFYESTNCISEELIEAAKNFLGETKQHFNFGLEWVAEIEERNGNDFVFDKNIMKDLWNELRPFEIYPKHADGKIMIMDGVVEDFVVFTAAYLSERYYNPSFLECIITKENEISLYMRFFQNQSVCDRFKDYLEVVAASEKDPKVLLSTFEKVLKERIKSSQMLEAQKEYEASKTENKTKIVDEASKEIVDHLNQIFTPIISEKELKGVDIRIPVLKVNDFSGCSLKKTLNNKYDYIAQGVISALCSILYRSNAVKLIHKSSFEDDMEYLDFLRTKEIALVIGSQYALRTTDYSHKKDLDTFLHNKKQILEGYADNALLIEEDSLHICFQSVNISAHSGVLGDVEFSFDSSNGLYTYEVMNGIPIEFTKEELIRYIHDKRRIVDIVLKISMEKKSGNIGYLLVP